MAPPPTRRVRRATPAAAAAATLLFLMLLRQSLKPARRQILREGMKRPIWTGAGQQRRKKGNRPHAARPSEGAGSHSPRATESSSRMEAIQAETDESEFNVTIMRELHKLLPSTQVNVTGAVNFVDGHMIANNRFGAFKDTSEQCSEFFQWMLFPKPIEQFLNDHMDTRPLVIKRDVPNYYRGWCTMEDFEKVFANESLRYRYDVDVTMFKDGRTCFVNPHNRSISATKVWEFFYRDGATVRLNRPQQWLRAMWKMLSVLDSYFAVTCGCNVYLTPPNGPCGYAPHANDVDSFVLMTEGSMRWRVYNPAPNSSLPLDPGPDVPLEELRAAPSVDTVLQSGDLLYIPRGHIYFAANVDQKPSCHLLLSTNQHHTWADFLSVLLQKAVDLSVSDAEFRRTLPLGWTRYMGFQHTDLNDTRRQDFVKTALDLMDAVVQRGYLPLDAAADQFAIDHLNCRVRPYDSTEQVIKTTSIADADWIKLTAEGIARYTFEDDGVRITHCLQNTRGGIGDDGTDILLESRFGPAVDILFNGYPSSVQVKELPYLKREEQRTFAEKLLELGIICKA